ncbi:Reticuline oxidase [Apostasia shenzhenica]|uniref:Reticuline oxidase n=1 Tax=Apostasia shenzhenica TaxID=1088818 RepID=A0A2I0A3K2_9ASPA|nr:Reticuline oxidase [Apostasia shenzhenica]
MEFSAAATASSRCLFPAALFFLFIPFVAAAATTTNGADSPDFASCLLAAGVNNFTIAAAAKNSPLHDRLLHFSIQNLRFSNPSAPRPAAVILPHDLPSLRDSILCCRSAFLSIRLRSGGHSYEALYLPADNRSPFALLDLMNLHSVSVDPDLQTAWLQSGATLGQLYHAIAATGDPPLAFSGGSCPTVGSGGHIAGGGFGFLSRKYGLAADNVLDAVIITADGRTLDRESMGEDLFWAIRGGGGGTWGAVYAWKVRLRPVPYRVSAFNVNRPGSNRRVADLVHSWQRVAPELPDEFYLSCFVGGGLPESHSAGMSATFKGLYLGPAGEARSIISDRFPELELGEAEIREMSWIESVVFFSGLKGGSVDDLLGRELSPKTFFKAKSDYVRAHIPLPDLIRTVDLLSEEPKAYLILDPYSGAMARGQSDDLPFPHRGGNLYAIQYLVEWMDGDDSRREEYLRWIREFYDWMAPMVSDGPRTAYVNYLDLDLGTVGCDGGSRDPVQEARRWGEKYFLGNYDRLVKVKTAVDPDNVFRNEQSIPPLRSPPEITGRSKVLGCEFVM